MPVLYILYTKLRRSHLSGTGTINLNTTSALNPILTQILILSAEPGKTE